MSFSGSSRESGNAGNAPSPETGMAVAIYNIPKSASPFDAEHGFSGWGGTRNRADRVSESLSLAQASNIIEAAQYATAIGLPFNRHVTIHWERAGVPDNRAAAATGRFLKLAGDWIAKRGSNLINNQNKSKRPARIAWAWVRENGDRKGSHVHILLHVPSRLITGKKRGRGHTDNTAWKQREGLGNMPRRWLRSITGTPYRSGTIKTQRIGGTAGAAIKAPAAYLTNLAVVVAYVLKGASPAAARALSLARFEAGGTIVGKRAATSENVGRAVRKHIAVKEVGESLGEMRFKK